MIDAQQGKQYAFVIRQLTARELKRKYARSYLGVIWSVLNPLLSMVVLSLIFSQLFRRSIENYPIYYLTGNILWQAFTGATNASMTSLVDNKMLLLKVKFPMELFILTREDPVNNPIEYVLESIKTIYSIKHKNGAIRRVNVNIAATTVENYTKLRDAGIGTYILFQETYNKENYEALHPTAALRTDSCSAKKDDTVTLIHHLLQTRNLFPLFHFNVLHFPHFSNLSITIVSQRYAYEHPNFRKQKVF